MATRWDHSWTEHALPCYGPPNGELISPAQARTLPPLRHSTHAFLGMDPLGDRRAAVGAVVGHRRSAAKGVGHGYEIARSVVPVGDRVIEGIPGRREPIALVIGESKRVAQRVYH